MDGWEKERNSGRVICLVLFPEVLVTTLLYTERTDIDIRWMEGRPRLLAEPPGIVMSWRYDMAG